MVAIGKSKCRFEPAIRAAEIRQFFPITNAAAPDASMDVLVLPEPLDIGNIQSNGVLGTTARFGAKRPRSDGRIRAQIPTRFVFDLRW